MILRNAKRLFRLNAYPYVCHKELNRIKEKYGQTKTQKAKMWTHMFQHRITTGFKQMKHDLQRYHQLRKVATPTNEQVQQRDRIYNDLKKLLPVFFIQAMPMTPLLFLAYLKYFPDAVPSWFDVDQDYFTRKKEYALKMMEASSQLDKANIEFNSCNVQELKLIATALTGKSVDGTNVLSQILKREVDFSSGPMSAISQALLKRQIRKTIENDPALHHHTDKSIDEKIAIKLTRKMMLPTQQTNQQPTALIAQAHAQVQKLEDKSQK